MQQAIIVGHPQSGYEHVVQLLQSAGMALARPSRREQLTPQQITATLLKAHGAPALERAKGEEGVQQIQTAPIWGGMVLDLMLGNLDEPLWGWADPRAVHLLDYWKAQDPRTVFVLVYDAPQTALSRLDPDQAAAPVDELQQRLDAWIAYNAALLAFYLRNPQRSVLVHAGQVQQSSRQYLKLVSARVDTPLQLPSSDGDQGVVTDLAEVLAVAAPATHGVQAATGEGLDANPQAQLLLGLVLQAHPQAQALYEELQAAAALPLDAGCASVPMASGAEPYRAWQAFVQLHQRAAEADDLRRQTDALRVAEQDAQQRGQQARQQVALLETRLQASQTEAQRLQAQHGGAVQEGELLLAQLHQVQEELERHYLQSRAQTEVASKAKAELEHKAVELKQAQAQAQKLQGELASAQAQGKEQAEAAGKAQAELQRKAAELKQAQAQAQKLQGELASAQAQDKEQTEATGKAQAELQRKAAELKQAQAQAQKLQAELASVQAPQNSELAQENELLLAQLHQVQEELERYYLENKRLAAEATKRKEPKPIYGAADRVKQQLSYRLGATMIEHSRSLGGWLSMPFALRAEARRFRKERAARAGDKLPPIERYADAHEAERIKQHLSYRLGARMIANSRSLGGWLAMPWALRAEVRAFRANGAGAASPATSNTQSAA